MIISNAEFLKRAKFEEWCRQDGEYTYEEWWLAGYDIGAQAEREYIVSVIQDAASQLGDEAKRNGLLMIAAIIATPPAPTTR
jgi:hypothetical protein